jgi:hypothetical protein
MAERVFLAARSINDELVAALAAAVGLPLPAERVAEVAAALEAQIEAGGGSSAEELERVEPAIAFEPRWHR